MTELGASALAKPKKFLWSVIRRQEAESPFSPVREKKQFGYPQKSIHMALKLAKSHQLFVRRNRKLASDPIICASYFEYTQCK